MNMLQRLAQYLPVALMGLLALGTWWLVRNAPIAQQPALERPQRHQPDYTMKSFSVKSFDAGGSLRSEVQGQQLRHYPDTGMFEIDQARIRSVSPEGQLTVATAQRALSNADGSEVQLFGNAIVTRAPLPAQPVQSAKSETLARPQMEFRGEYLHAFTTAHAEHLRSNQPVTLTRGRDHFTADGMEYDHPSQVLQLHGRVRGTLLPGR